jgi:DNA invertase Pin-like site-specific DNA recombinase
MFYAISNPLEKAQILEFAQEKGILIDKFTESLEIEQVSKDDTIIAKDLTSIASHFIKSISQCILAAKKGAKVLFVENPELSIDSAEKLQIFDSILSLEKKFISIRTKAGQKAAKESGKKIGRPTGSTNKLKVLDDHKEKIQEYLKKQISVKAIMKIINSDLNKPLSYFTYRRFVENLCK